MAQNASSDKKISVQPTAIIRGNKKAGEKDSRRRISCKELGNGECEGWLWRKKKPGFAPNSWRKYWFMLKDKSLYCYKNPHDVVARRLYHMPAFVVSVARETSRKYAFKISHASYGTVLFAAKDYADMSRWMTPLILSCKESETDKRKKSDADTGDISESDNEEENTEDEEEEEEEAKNSLKPVIEKGNETEDKDLTCAATTVMCLSDSTSSAVSSCAEASKTESMPLASSNKESIPVGISEPQSTLLTSSDLESNPVGLSEPISTFLSSSKQESNLLAASKQESSQLICPQPKSVHIISPEPESNQSAAEASEPVVAAKKTSGPATSSKPKSSPKSSPATEPSASPTSERLSQARTPFGPVTYSKSLPTTSRPSSTTDSSATCSVPFLLARAAFETASSSKLLPSMPGVAAAKLRKMSFAAEEDSAKTPTETPSQGTANIGPATHAKPSSASIVKASLYETSAVAPILSLSGRAMSGSAFYAKPLTAASLARASSATEHSTKQSAASPTNSKEIGPTTCAKSSAIPQAMSDTLQPSWTVSDSTSSPQPIASVNTSCTASFSDGDSTLPSSEAQSRITESETVLQKEKTSQSSVTSLSGNEKEEVGIQSVHQNYENSSSQSDRTSEISKDETADELQSVEPLPELSPTIRAHMRMTLIAKSIRLKSKPSPANRYQELRTRLLILQRSFKDKMQELQILEELLKTSLMTSDRLKQFCNEHRDIAKRLTGNSLNLKESSESDVEKHLQDVPSV